MFLGLGLVSVPVGMVVGEFAMLFVYGIAVLPIGLVFRLVGRDPLQRGFDRRRRHTGNSENHRRPGKLLASMVNPSSAVGSFARNTSQRAAHQSSPLSSVWKAVDQTAAIRTRRSPEADSMPRNSCCSLRRTEKWWLLPIVAFLALLLGLVMFAGTAAAPLIYTMF